MVRSAVPRAGCNNKTKVTTRSQQGRGGAAIAGLHVRLQWAFTHPRELGAGHWLVAAGADVVLRIDGRGVACLARVGLLIRIQIIDPERRRKLLRRPLPRLLSKGANRIRMGGGGGGGGGGDQWWEHHHNPPPPPAAVLTDLEAFRVAVTLRSSARCAMYVSLL